MKVLAVGNTHPLEDLREADLVTTSLAAVTLEELERDIWGSA
jgi:hypothetical protein